MKVTAILAIHNEEVYLANCLRHLIRNGIDFVIIDNGSTDGSSEIYRRREFAHNLVDVQDFPCKEVFSLTDQLKRKAEFVRALDTDWVIHLDADEVMHSNVEGEALNETLSRLDAAGWNAVNFDEFVFLPIENDYVPESSGHQPIVHYYFFQPSSPRLIRAWKKANSFSFVEHGGHLLVGPDLRLAPEHLVLRHYIVHSQQHAYYKYTSRKFSLEEIAQGWHCNRANQPLESFRFPAARSLRRIPASSSCEMDRTDPWKVHYWQCRGLDRKGSKNAEAAEAACQNRGD